MTTQFNIKNLNILIGLMFINWLQVGDTCFTKGSIVRGDIPYPSTMASKQ